MRINIVNTYDKVNGLTFVYCQWLGGISGEPSKIVRQRSALFVLGLSF